MRYAKGRRAVDEWALCALQGEVDTAKWGMCAHSFPHTVTLRHVTLPPVCNQGRELFICCIHCVPPIMTSLRARSLTCSVRFLPVDMRSTKVHTSTKIQNEYLAVFREIDI